MKMHIIKIQNVKTLLTLVKLVYNRVQCQGDLYEEMIE